MLNENTIRTIRTWLVEHELCEDFAFHEKMGKDGQDWEAELNWIECEL